VRFESDSKDKLFPLPLPSFTSGTGRIKRTSSAATLLFGRIATLADSVPRTLASASKLGFRRGVHICPGASSLHDLQVSACHSSQQASAGGRNGQVYTWDMGEEEDSGVDEKLYRVGSAGLGSIPKRQLRSSLPQILDRT
jgi:hypothetical protein